jgi:hypothetical protein
MIPQHRALRAAGRLAQQRLLRTLPPDATIDVPAEYVDALIDSPTLSEVREAAKPLFARAALVGHVVAEIIGRRDRGVGRAQIGAVQHDVAQRFSSKQKITGYKVSRSSVESAWGDWRSVAHLWAAYVSRSVRLGDLVFPCRHGSLAVFLGLAEAYRQIGETWRPKQGDRTLLDAEQTWQVADAIMLPVPETVPPFRLDRALKIPG